MSDSPLPLWLLAGLFVAVLIVGHVVAWLAWRTGRQAWLAAMSAAPQRAPSTAATGTSKAAAEARMSRPESDPQPRKRGGAKRMKRFPLTPYAVVVAALVLIDAWLAGEVIAHGTLVRFDHDFNVALAPLRNPAVLDLAAGLAYLADVVAVFATLLLGPVVLWLIHRGRFIPGLWITLVGAEATTQIAKHLIGRPRPDLLSFVTETSPSFPSNHATAAIVVYGFIAYVLARHLRSHALRFEVVWWAGVLVALIATSRLILSVHYASDVVAGLVTGGLWLLIGIACSEYLTARAARQ